MSIKQLSTETSRVYWSSEEQRGRLNLNEEEEEEEMEVVVSRTEEDEKEAMFEKPLTPSDVGKLNRLVIPKQHAEKHFPQDSAAKGLLLSFEDESGKCWRFRYSYWNSSQSYVLTKGWSRYVKDKRLHAGDVVFFHRHRQHPQRFFISSTTRSLHPFPYQQPLPGGVSQAQAQAQNQMTPSSSGGRVLRLFGVNMECQPDHHNHSQNSYTTHTHHSSNPHMLRQQP